MRVYLDVGVFVDYLTERSHAGGLLRTADRNGRSPQQLSSDATQCVQRLKNHHEPMTSSITLFEAENAVYGALREKAGGLADLHQYIISSARCIVTQILTAVLHNNILVIPLDTTGFNDVAANVQLQTEAVRAADAIHATCAIRNNAEIILSTDAHLLRLDGKMQNSAGTAIRCMDTDQALTIL